MIAVTFLPDFGPQYAETVMGRFPVEPFNTYSNGIFLLTVVWFAYRTKLSISRYPFLFCALPVLCAGFIGGTIFHATRSNRLWLLMDYLPILILTLATSAFFWRQLGARWWQAAAGVVLPFLFIRLVFLVQSIPMLFRITFGYASLATFILLPAFLLASNYKRDLRLLVTATCFFVVALACRFADMGFGLALLPMGTHFLWHLGGGIATFCMVGLVRRAEERSEERLK